MSRSATHAFVLAAAFAALAAPAEAQLIGPNLGGIMFVSPLDPPSDPAAAVAPQPNAAARAAARATATRLLRLEPIRRDVARATKAGAAAQRAADPAAKQRNLEAAVRDLESARRRVASLRGRWAADEEFTRSADELAFVVRKELARHRRELRVDAAPQGVPAR